MMGWYRQALSELTMRRGYVCKCGDGSGVGVGGGGGGVDCCE